MLKALAAELCQNACGVVDKQKIFHSHQCSPECSMNKFRAYIHRHVFRPFRDSSVWLGLSSRKQLISPECSKHQVLSFAKMLVVWWTNKKYSILISVLQSAQWINLERISTDTCFVLSRTHQCGSGYQVENNWCHQTAQSTIYIKYNIILYYIYNIHTHNRIK